DPLAVAACGNPSLCFVSAPRAAMLALTICRILYGCIVICQQRSEEKTQTANVKEVVRSAADASLGAACKTARTKQTEKTNDAAKKSRLRKVGDQPRLALRLRVCADRNAVRGLFRHHGSHHVLRQRRQIDHGRRIATAVNVEHSRGQPFLL